MKKIFLSVLLGAFLMTGAFANQHGKTAVVYFSVTGTTEKMAKSTAEEMKADIFEIVPSIKYSQADLNWRNKKSRTSIECNDPKARPEIASKIDIAGYDTVILCYPIWWAYAPKIIYTFVESQDWTGKQLVTLCTSGSSGLGKSGLDLSQYAKGVTFKGGKDFTGKSGAEVKKYIEEILK